MSARLEIDDSGQAFAVVGNSQYIERPGQDPPFKILRLPDKRLPIIIEADGTLCWRSKGPVRELLGIRPSFDMAIQTCCRCRKKFIGTARAIYCGGECQSAEVSERAKRRRRRRTVRKCNCRECGKAFDGKRTTARFCSNACRQKSHRNAKRKPIT